MKPVAWFRTTSASVALFCGAAAAESLETLQQGFRDPPASHHTVPFWVWNDELTPAEATWWLEEFVRQGIRSVMIHPRPGLRTPYLGERWFELWAHCVREAQRLGMELWIYDENSYPSGFGGGHVPEAMPDAKAVNLVAQESKRPPAWTNAIVAVWRLDGERPDEVSARLSATEALPEGRYLTVLTKTEGRAADWYGGWWYVDLLRPGVTEKFLEVTLEPYRERFADRFGRLIRGTFTDEPHISGTGGLPWTADFAEQFRKRRGYELQPLLAALWVELGDWRRVRHDFARTAHELFVERWAIPYHEYCRRHGLELTGHYWEHQWPLARQVPDNMAMYLWMQRPGIDILFNQYAEGPAAQFGNVRSVRELQSVALQAGRPRTLCEAYGGSGWDVRFEDLKRIGDWLLALGVNTINQHLSHVSIRGARKRDYPVSFSYHAPWWDFYGAQARYFARLQWVLTQGEVPPAAALVIEPTTTCWMYQEGPKASARAVEIAEAFHRLLGWLEAAQIEYELGSEDVIGRIGTAVGGRLRVGRRQYSTVVLPPGTENLSASTVRMLAALLRDGGTVFACGPPPDRVDGQTAEEPARLAREAGWRRIEPEALAGALAPNHAPGARVVRADTAGKLFHHRRRIGDDEMLLLVNTSSNEWSRGHVLTPARSAEDWDAFTGRIFPAPAEVVPSGLRVPFALPPAGSRLLRLSASSGPVPPPAPPASGRRIELAGPIRVRRLDPATLPLDFVEVDCAGRRTNLHVVAAADWIFQQHGLAKNPWRHAVQYRDRLITVSFPPDSGFAATYRFVIDGAPPPDLEAVVERPDLYSIECNGQPVQPAPGAWWLDRAFGRVPIATIARSGTNTLVLRARPMTMLHELDQVVLLGDFLPRPAEKGFAIVPAQPLHLGSWSAQGLPTYAGRVEYSADVEMTAGEPLRVRLPSWWGTVAEVRVADRSAGLIAAPPYELELPADLPAGRHTIAVTVVGTLKNLLGPFHAGPVRGLASPFNMAQAPRGDPPPGAAYDVIPCGLFEPFVVETLR
ncbi:MAG: glycosyl hydrolase [Kiritimatiellae bacterium]|nr:glycosyl hydrolase [Kiritimatiellia bacterium]